MNSIFTQSKTSPYFVDELSKLTINYSISDAFAILGTGNIFADPMLRNEFRLAAASPAIDSGDPTGEKDPDGSTADMGAYPFDKTEDFSIVISEIHYYPREGEDYEFIELTNTSMAEVDVSGYHLQEPLDFTFPIGTKLKPGEYVVIAHNADHFNRPDYRSFTWYGGGLPDTGANIELKNLAGKIVDLVNYNRITNWPESAYGSGPSLELREVQRENLYYANWRASVRDGGSPGSANEISSLSDVYINEIMARNRTYFSDENGEFDDWIEIYNGGTRTVDFGGLYLSDDSTNLQLYQIPTTSPQETTVGPGAFKLLWADSDESQGALHLNFQLDGDGEHIFLSQAIAGSTHVINDFKYEQLPDDLSAGRFPDGDESISLLQFATPGTSNNNARALRKGILLVNGVSFETYDDEIYSAYFDKTFYGDYPITFWDCFDELDAGYPSYLPQPIGHGAVPFEILYQYSTVIWVGNNYGGDLQSWQDTPIMKYLALGGNVLLMARLGETFLSQEMMEYLAISWRETRTRISNCKAVHGSLQNLLVTGGQSLVSVFDPVLSNSESKLLFQETVSFDDQRGLGVWRRPQAGGRLKSNGGQFIFLSGRPYRYGHSLLRQNIEFILGSFFFESKINSISDSEENTVVRAFALHQNYPNPFNPQTLIEFEIPRATEVSLKIYDIRGKLVRRLVRDNRHASGRYRVIWHGKNDQGISVSSGAYFYKLQAGDFTAVKKMLLLH